MKLTPRYIAGGVIGIALMLILFPAWTATHIENDNGRVSRYEGPADENYPLFSPPSSGGDEGSSISYRFDSQQTLARMAAAALLSPLIVFIFGWFFRLARSAIGIAKRALASSVYELPRSSHHVVRSPSADGNGDKPDYKASVSKALFSFVLAMSVAEIWAVILSGALTANSSGAAAGFGVIAVLIAATAALFFGKSWRFLGCNITIVVLASAICILGRNAILPPNPFDQFDVVNQAPR